MLITARRRAATTAAATALLAGALMALPLDTASAAEAGTYDDRTVEGAGAHVDAIYPLVDDGHLTVKSLTPDGVENPDAIALHIPVTKTSKVTLPDGYGFLGKKGSTAYGSGQAQDKSVVWPGWSFEGIRPGVLKGTVKIDMTGYSYAGEAKDPKFAVTQPGGLSGKKVSQIFVPGTLYTSTSGEVGSHTHASWLFNAQGTYDVDFDVVATLADGTEITDDATLRFVVGDLDEANTDPKPVDVPAHDANAKGLTLSPNKVDAEYFVGQTIILTAVSAKDTDRSAYRWYVKKDGADSWTEDPEQTKATFTTKPDRDLDKAQVYAELLDSDGTVLQKSKATTLRVAQHTQTTRLTAQLDKDAYTAGDTATITSKQTPETEDEHYHWYLKLPGADEYEWIPESRLADQELGVTEEHDGAHVVARLFNTDHAVLAESPAQTLHVGSAATAAATLTGPTDSVAAGDAARFSVTTVSGADHYEWSVRMSGENPFTELQGDETSLTKQVNSAWSGAEVRAVAVDASGTALAEATATLGDVQNDDAGSAASASSDAVPTTAIIIGGIVVVVLIIAVAIFLLLRRRRSSEAN